MTETVTAVCENGVLRPSTPLMVPDGTTVRLALTPAEELSPGQRTAAVVQQIAALRIVTGPVEHTSENVDAVLFGKAGPA